jgi:hypothetical protein
MNLVNIISNKERLGGLELTDSGLRFSLLKKKGDSLEIKTLADLELSKNEGVESFISSDFSASKLKQFAGKYKISYVVLSIPSSWTFAKTYAFPSIMPDEKANDSIKLVAEFQLPQKPGDIYWDSQKYSNPPEDKGDKIVLLSYAKRALIDTLIANVKKAGLKVIALENRALSLARAIEQKADEILLTIERHQSQTAFYVIRNKRLLFLESLPNDKLGDDLNKEIKKISNYFNWLESDINGLFLIGNFKAPEIKNLPLKIIIPKLSAKIKTKDKIDPASFVVLGAAWRASWPRKADNAISLMAIGTEEAYRQAKANASLGFLAGATVALALFFVAAFYAIWMLIAMTQANFNEQISTFNNSLKTDPTTAQSRAQNFNKLVGASSALLSSGPKWSTVISEIQAHIGPDLIIKSVNLPDISGTFTITGTAASRDSINQLRQSLESSIMLDTVLLPLDNLGKKENIPFSATFKLRAAKL